jgi:phage terminase large subunit GpA-like protein
LDSFDTSSNQVKSVSKMQEYYNNTLGIPFKVLGSKLQFTMVSAHRRSSYVFGQIPNTYAEKYSGSKILFVTCLVDVHGKKLFISLLGWTRDARCYVIEYITLEVEEGGEDCRELTSSVWGRLTDLLENKRYVADDGTEYTPCITFIDAGYANDTVVTFCSQYASGVYPILGRKTASKAQAIKEFRPFKTSAGTVGYVITIDHYKDRLAQVLRRQWDEQRGVQGIYHFNAPIDITDKQLKELTTEYRKEKIETDGSKSYSWYRPGNAPNELWDLLVYGSAAVEVIAYSICIERFELETVDWSKFWDFAATDQADKLLGR